MARVKGGGGANVGLRAALLADAIEFRGSQVRHANGDCPELEAIAGRPLSRNPALAEAMQRELSKPVDQLAAGEECLIHRFDLPDDHPERDAGYPCDHVILGTDDVLRPA